MAIVENWEKQIHARPHFSLGEVAFFCMNMYPELKTIAGARGFVFRARENNELKTFRISGKKHVRVRREEVLRFLGIV